MFNISDRTTINTIRSTFDSLGVKAPKEVAAAFERADVVAERIGAMGSATELSTAVRNALLAGREACDDPDVQRAVTASALAANQSLAGNVIAVTLDEVREACLVHLDAIVTSWAKVADKAAIKLSEAHQQIGDYDLDETGPIMAKGGNIADAWAEAKYAAQTIDIALDGWVNLMRLVRVSLNPNQRALKVASMTYAQWRAAPDKITPWDAVRAGLTVSLPTLEEYRARIAKVEAGRAVAEGVEAPVDPQREAVKSWTRKVTQAQAVAS